MDGDQFVVMKGAVNAMYEEVFSSFHRPYNVFRNYSVEYMHRQLLEGGMVMNASSNADEHSCLSTHVYPLMSNYS